APAPAVRPRGAHTFGSYQSACAPPASFSRAVPYTWSFLTATLILIMNDFQPHTARRASNNAYRCLYSCRIEIRHLSLGNLPHLRSCDLANFFTIWRPRPFDNACRLLQQGRSRGRFRDERKRAVRIDGHHNWSNHASLSLRLRIEGFAKLHDI